MAGGPIASQTIFLCSQLAGVHRSPPMPRPQKLTPVMLYFDCPDKDSCWGSHES